MFLPLPYYTLTFSVTFGHTTIREYHYSFFPRAGCLYYHLYNHLQFYATVCHPYVWNLSAVFLNLGAQSFDHRLNIL